MADDLPQSYKPSSLTPPKREGMHVKREEIHGSDMWKMSIIVEQDMAGATVSGPRLELKWLLETVPDKRISRPLSNGVGIYYVTENGAREVLIYRWDFDQEVWNKV